MRCLFWLSQKMFRHKKRRSSECYLAAIHYLSFGGFFANFERETDETSLSALGSLQSFVLGLSASALQ
ncbi:hypothetical protein C8C93_0617 [Acidovorax sp. 93]|nr:hypothetical protein C8C93_0617 [Acidovorax sp. 93]